jgi:hypothetical protein
MSRPLPQFKSTVTLVPHSGIQFLDFGFIIDGATRVNRAFREEDDSESGAKVLVTLVSEDGELRHPITNAPAEPLYTINAQRALEPFLGTWTPLPFMRVLGRDAAGRDVYDQGPSNWARVFIEDADAASAAADKSYRVVLAFDTELDARDRVAERPYLTPTMTDARGEETFGFSAHEDDVGWFLAEGWVDQWLEETFHDAMRRRDRNKRFKPENLPNALEHAARYLTLLRLLEQLTRFPKIRLIDNISSEKSYVPIGVDLVIDVGNSRTCGILIESDPDAANQFDLSNSYVLSLRDLSSPTLVHTLPFESRVEFSRASFGKEGISRVSGRATAFYWPSLTRIGPEAVRLSVGGTGTEGATGMSSPKRYLWDRRTLNQVWRFRDSSGTGQDTQVSGSILAFITEEGDVLRQLKRQGASAIRPKFSRSSLFTFLMAEVVLQALGAINSVESRGRQRYSDVPRELRQIIMTVPPATPLAERRIMRERVQGAVKLVWQALGWTDARKFTPPPEPAVQIAFDEATCTQLVYLYSEITQKLQHPAADFFSIMGKVRPTVSRDPTLRIASIDIGGGTTDLMIITYLTEARRAIVPIQMFREGFKIAGDDILEAVVGRQVLPAIEAHLSACGMTEARSFLRGLVGADRGGQSEQERQFRRRLVTQICVPAALALLRQYEDSRPFSAAAPVSTPLAALLGGDGNPRAVADFDALAARAGVSGFALAETPVSFDADEMAATVQSIIAPVLSDLAEVVHALDCDVVLISGRPSRLPIVLDLLMSRVPTRPDRIIPMHQYRVGKWYPFRDAFDRVSDPKTTVAVGALLCNLAEAQIDGFVLAKSKLQIKSTARYIGEMELSGVIRNESLLFSDIDLDGKRRADQSAKTVAVFPPTTIGFRQLALERWPATPLYVIEYSNPSSAARLRLPLKVTIERAEADEDDESRLEDFKITEVVDAEGTPLRPSDVAMRLQTLKSPSGYWLDTGVVESY